MIHQLKTDPLVFDAVAAGLKTFEIRKNDRGYQVGDILVLCRTEFTGEQMKAGSPLKYTGDMLTRVVTHVLHGPIYGLADGWVIMSIGRK